MQSIQRCATHTVHEQEVQLPLGSKFLSATPSTGDYPVSFDTWWLVEVGAEPQSVGLWVTCGAALPATARTVQYAAVVLQPTGQVWHLWMEPHLLGPVRV